MMELTTENLLLHFRREAGLVSCLEQRKDLHWGWDSPLSDLRGTVTGHWLSAAARLIRTTGDPFLKAKADAIVSGIGECQKEHGNGWMFPIPEKNLYWLKRGKHSWAPQYVCHKSMLGLLEMYTFTGNREALGILLAAADWFSRFISDIPDELMDDMMDWEETGGMMELWADLYALTKDEKHLALMRKYERRRLFDRLLAGEDMLTNMHANTTIPEIHGAVRAFEVTGEERYRKVVEAYWELAVTQRGMYATGGQTCGEIWTPRGLQSARLGERNQEHCVVYNMIRLADYLLKWTGDKRYADYIERNLWNGLLAQGYWQESRVDVLDCDIPVSEWKRGLVAYYLPLAAGSKKRWASRLGSFWCCVNTLLQANAVFQDFSLYADDRALYVQQYHGVKCETLTDGTPLRIRVETDSVSGESVAYSDIQRRQLSRPDFMKIDITIEAESTISRELRVRIPFWSRGEITVTRNGTACAAEERDGYLVITGGFEKDTVSVIFPRPLTVHPLPDEPDTVAFLDGPLVLAGLCENEITLYGDVKDPSTILKPADERVWQTWQQRWKTRGQAVNIDFRPLYTIGDRPYTVYFPVGKK